MNNVYCVMYGRRSGSSTPSAHSYRLESFSGGASNSDRGTSRLSSSVITHPGSVDNGLAKSRAKDSFSDVRFLYKCNHSTPRTWHWCERAFYCFSEV